jgi:hypothetical protein
MLDFHVGYLLGTEISWYCIFFVIKLYLSWQIPPNFVQVFSHSLGLLPQFPEKNQLQYLLVAPMAVDRTSRVDKTAALTGLPLHRIIGS